MHFTATARQALPSPQHFTRLARGSLFYDLRHAPLTPLLSGFRPTAALGVRPAMQNVMRWLAERRGVKVVRIAIPEPATHDNVLAAYTTARDRTINLHKWIGAPLGVAAFYIRKGRLQDVDRMMGEQESTPDRILSRVHTGTTNFAAFLTIPAALDFHAAVGGAHKAARLRYLRDRWVMPLRDRPNIQVLTPDDPRMSAGMTSFRFRGRTSAADNNPVVETLLNKHGIFTRRSPGVEAGDCVRVTPALYTRAADVDRLAASLETMT